MEQKIQFPSEVFDEYLFNARISQLKAEEDAFFAAVDAIKEEEVTVSLDKLREIREFGIKKVGKKLVISPVFCIFIVENQNTTKRTSDDYQGQSYRDFLYY